MARRPWAHDELAAGVRAGDHRALARAISLVENGDVGASELVQELYPETGKAFAVGVTGSPGVGKSALVSALVRHVRSLGLSVGVVSVDPSSPFTHGALLGDRIRLSDHFLDPGVFIRSMGTRGHAGGLAQTTLQVLLLLDAAGKDVVFVETVGAGQTEVAVRTITDMVLLVLMPGTGDSVQALKAGIMEIPDVIAVNKMDQPGAKAMVGDVRSVLSLAPSDLQPPIVLTESLHGEGVEELWRILHERREELTAAGEIDARRQRNVRGEAVAAATARVQRAVEDALASDPRLGELVEAVERRELDPLTAGRAHRRRRARKEHTVSRPELADLTAARERLTGVARVTPVLSSGTLGSLTGRTVALKAENLQLTGSFKIRGAYNTIVQLSEAERRQGVVTASAGNHGQAVAWAAREAGIQATIFVPASAPMAKVDAASGYGADVVLGGEGFDDAVAAARAHVASTGATFVHAFDDPRVVAGQGTLGLELAEQLPPGPGTVVIPVGGGGLAGGIAIGLRALRPELSLVGVQAAACAPYAGLAPTGPTIADGIAIKIPAELTKAIISDLLDEIVVVEDEAISRAIVLLLERSKLVVEGAGAAPVAALLGGLVPGPARCTPSSRAATSTRRRSSP